MALVIDLTISTHALWKFWFLMKYGSVNRATGRHAFFTHYPYISNRVDDTKFFLAWRFKEHWLWQAFQIPVRTCSARSHSSNNAIRALHTTSFMGPTWGPPGPCRPQMGPMLTPWTLLSGQSRRNHTRHGMDNGTLERPQSFVPMN